MCSVGGCPKPQGAGRKGLPEATLGARSRQSLGPGEPEAKDDFAGEAGPRHGETLFASQQFEEGGQLRADGDSLGERVDETSQFRLPGKNRPYEPIACAEERTGSAREADDLLRSWRSAISCPVASVFVAPAKSLRNQPPARRDAEERGTST
jgi:hypothetical protein